MGRRKKVRICERCGAHLPEGRQQRYCLDCGLKKAEDAAVQLAQHSGPLYEKWREGLRRHLEATSPG